MRLAVSVLFISSIGWGLTWIPIKFLNESGLDSLSLIFIAFISAALVLLPGLFRQYAQWKSQAGFLLLIALAGGFTNAAFQAAMAHGEVIRVMILFYMLPVWSVIGGRLFLKEHIDMRRLLAVSLCLVGAFVILDVWHNAWRGISWVDLLAIGSGLGLAITNILFRFTQDIPATSKVSAMFLGCALLVSVPLLFSPSGLQLPQNGAVLYAAVYGAVWITLITFGTQWAVTQMEAGRSSVIIVTELVVAVISAAWLTDASLEMFMLAGGVMVVSAALIEGLRQEEEVALQTVQADS